MARVSSDTKSYLLPEILEPHFDPVCNDVVSGVRPSCLRKTLVPNF